MKWPKCDTVPMTNQPESNLTPPPGDPDTTDWTFVLTEPCPECGFDPDYDSADTGARTRAAIQGWTAVLEGSGASTRPAPTTWSPVEYACHVRDVQLVFAGRLTDMLSLDDAKFANWDGEQAAIDGRYWDQDPAVVAAALSDSAGRIAAVFDSVSGAAWERTGTRGDGRVFTVAEFARYFLHEVEHHLRDARG